MSTQTAFAAALLDMQQPCPEGLFSANGANPASRFAVYRNNVHSSLINALTDSYPVVAQLVGSEFFRSMAQIYVQNCPPTSPLINDYGQDLAEFIAGFEPAASVPYLADIARLERWRVNAYHASDVRPLSHEQIAAMLSANAPHELHIGLHPSLALLNSPFAVVAIWAAHQQEATLAGIDLYQGQNALILRNGLEVEVFAIDAGACAFIHNLQNEQSLAQALKATPVFDLSQTLALLISRNAITHLHLKASS
ncbi:DUF2063 domain-containing protein [Pseudomonas sp. NPDC087346]|uniref:HvfC/BufC N-terminal domain-containing protein n=1 Tax=Pseudomonas sp. NPDC087346 TaxID=3364438 RepID=UPI00382BF329